MVTIEIVYEGQLRTIATHQRSGVQLMTDAPLDNQGKGEMFSPSDLLVTSLGTCILTTIGIAAGTHEFSIEGASMVIQKIMASSPRKVEEIRMRLKLPALSYTDKQKQIIENTAKTCPVALSLHPDLKKVIEFEYAS